MEETIPKPAPVVGKKLLLAGVVALQAVLAQVREAATGTAEAAAHPTSLDWAAVEATKESLRGFLSLSA